MARTLPQIEHLLRRAGFGGSETELSDYGEMGYAAAVEALINFDPAASNAIDDFIRTPGYIGVTATRAFEPQTNITDTRQRWLFRMVHTPSPLQEKMALFWHNHFATGYNKIAGVVGPADGARLMDSRASRDPLGMNGQIELFRTMGLGKFTDLLTEVSKHASMAIWLDGRQNTRNSPQENFGREIIELFTMGVANYVETDVYAAARVFTGWNYTRTLPAGSAIANYTFQFNANQHEPAAKTFSFPIYSNGSKTIPARAQTQGLQDGIDLIVALAHHPETARRLARKLWTFFVSEVREPDAAFVESIAQVYLANDTDMKPVMRAVFNSPQFASAGSHFERYAWPVEFVVRSIKEIGFLGFSVSDTLTPLVNMGQTLYEPPDVSGWDTGTWWFSTGGMLARMNFAAQLVTNQKFNLRDLARPYRSSPESLITGFALSRLTIPMPDPDVYNALLTYVRAGGNWTGSETQLTNKAGGTVHLLAGSADYQFV
ncbi:MAG: DUF1800 domain-containing protein [Acidobacteria bacterium]|nr:MAG: DUF1800 domain-containing protein [Acidobacteriota bacterium]